jgi:hypothetical protein
VVACLILVSVIVNTLKLIKYPIIFIAYEIILGLFYLLIIEWICKKVLLMISKLKKIRSMVFGIKSKHALYKVWFHDLIFGIFCSLLKNQHFLENNELPYVILDNEIIETMPDFT